ncbi:hypothetical protein [Spirosoma foliorum]|uniref:hypothetical protein n=1 Tax=Spirosoma foliorum TaxID=2710596 RepID=UPI001C70F121|nr:hypothetical protein [Spirosoma foliorum]
MSDHVDKFEDEKKSEMPEIYDQELDPVPELPVRPLVTIYAVLVAISFLLLVLKQTGQIDWAWWWISLPLWLAPIGFMFLALIVLLLAVWQELKRAFHIR